MSIFPEQHCSALLYAAFRFLHKQVRENTTTVRLLFAGRIALVLTTLKTFEFGFVVSFILGLFATVLSIIALVVIGASLYAAA